MHIAVPLVLVAVLARTEGFCAPVILGNIEYFWNGKPPTDILKKIEGVITWASKPLFFSDRANISCAQTFVTRNGSSVHAMDVLHYTDTPNQMTTKSYNMVEKDAGIIKQTDGEDSNDERLYILTLKEHTLIYFQCKKRYEDTYAGFGGLALINIDNKSLQNSKFINNAIYAANKVMKKLNLPTVDPLTTDCPMTPSLKRLG